VLALERSLELPAHVVELGNRGLHDHLDGGGGRGGGGGCVRDRDCNRVGIAVLLALELGAQARAEAVLGLGRRHLNTVRRCSIAGPRTTMNIDGKMKNTVGSSILIGAFMAFSSAAA